MLSCPPAPLPARGRENSLNSAKHEHEADYDVECNFVGEVTDQVPLNRDVNGNSKDRVSYQ